MAVSSPYVTQWGYTDEAEFDNAAGSPTASATSNFTTFEGPPPSVDYGLTEDRSIKHRGIVFAHESDAYSSLAGGLRVISFSDMVVRQEDLAVLLYLVTQTVDEGETPAFQKDFDIDASYTIPDFSADAGYFVSIGIKDTVASFHRHFPSCILRTLTLSADLTGDGRLRASGEFISGFVPDTAINFNTGTWGFNTQVYYNFASPTAKTIATVNSVMSGFEMTFNNNAGRVGNTATGTAENYKMGIPEFEITGSFTSLYDSVTDSTLADFIAGTSRALNFKIGTATNAGYADFAFPTVKFTGNEQDYANENGRMVTLPWKAMGATLFNGQVDDLNDQSWPT